MLHRHYQQQSQELL